MTGELFGPVVPPAWHPDPQDPSRQRWWDGTGWTENVRPASMLPPIANPNLVGDAPAPPDTGHGAPSPLGQAAVPSAAPPSASAFFGVSAFPTPYPAPEPAPSPGVAPASEPFAGFSPRDSGVAWAARGTLDSALDEPSGYIPMSSMESSWGSDHAEISAPLGSRYTPGLWMIGLLPLVHVLFVYLVFDFFVETDFNSAAQSALTFGPLALYILAARWDARTLVERGHSAPPFAVLAILPPLYLLIRAFRAPGSSIVMLTLWGILEGAAIALLLSQSSLTIAGFTLGATSAPTPSPAQVAANAGEFDAPFTAEKRAYILTPQGMAEKLEYDYAAGGIRVDDLVCEPLTSLEPTAQTRCSGTLLGTPLLVTVVVGSDTDQATSPIFIAG